MIDRIEELLSEMTAEDDEEQEGDVLAQKHGAVASSRLKSEWSENGESPEGRTAFEQSESLGRVASRRSVTTERRGAGDRSGGRTAEEIMLELPGSIAGEMVVEKAQAVGETAVEKAQAAGETAVEKAQVAGELWKDGPIWTVRGGSPEMDEAQGTATAGQTVRAEEISRSVQERDLAWTGLERAIRGGTAGLALESARRSGPARTGLEGLYRQTVQGLRPAAPALPPEQAGRTAWAQEPGSAASLAVDELDRAVRRDSRRYDGGLSIY